MYELLKTLTEEPGRIRKLIIYLVRIILCSIVASVIYRYYYGAYELIDFSDHDFWQQLFNFFIGGKILLVLFLYLISNVVLYELLSILPSLILDTFAKNDKDYKQIFDKSFLGGTLRFFGVVAKDKESRKYTVGRHFDAFYSGLYAFQNKATKDEIAKLANSFLSEIVTTYFIFIIVFYGFTDINLPGLLDFILIGACVFFALSYIHLCKLIMFFSNHGPEVLRALYALHIESIVNSSLTNYKLSFSDFRASIKDTFSKTVAVNDKDYLLYYYGGELNLPSKLVEHCLALSTKYAKGNCVLITNSILTEKATKLVEGNSNIILICFTEEANLQEKLNKLFYDQ